jgi:hypothetical protein
MDGITCDSESSKKGLLTKQNPLPHHKREGLCQEQEMADLLGPSGGNHDRAEFFYTVVTGIGNIGVPTAVNS